MEDGVPIRAISRAPFPLQSGHGVVADLSDKRELAVACEGVQCVFHCAGYAHAFSSLTGVDDTKHRQVNFEGTRNLLEAAATAGVGTFVFLSSVKAMADPGDGCADEQWPGEPDSDYGLAKRAAEEAVIEAGIRHGMHVTNLRLAMVYGSGGRGNLERMVRLVKRGWFPPLPETGNHRSLVHVDDVVRAMRMVASDQRAAGQTYVIAAQEAPSGRQLYDAIRSALGLPAIHWAVPRSVMRAAARIGDGLEAISGKRMPLDSEVMSRLLGSAWYSAAKIERELGWRAEVGLQHGLRELVGR